MLTTELVLDKQIVHITCQIWITTMTELLNRNANNNVFLYLYHKQKSVVKFDTDKTVLINSAHRYECIIIYKTFNNK